MSDKQINMDIDSLLDGTLDDLADMPEFKPFPVGTHKVTFKAEIKKIEKDTAVEVGMVAIETVELPAGSEDTPLAAGDNTNILYFLTHSNPKVAEMGQGQFKELMKQVAEHFGAKSNRELVECLNGAEGLVVTGQRQNKDKTKSYTTIEGVQF